MPLCNVCGKQNREQARFCGYCGQPLQGSPSQPAQETRKAPQVVSSARWLVWLVLGPFWFLSTGLGFTVVAIWLTTRSVPERAIFFNKLAYEVGGVGVAVLIGVSLIIAGRLTRAVIMKIRQRRNDLIAAGIMHLLRTNPRARHREFFLYLRAFETTGQLNIPLYLRLRKLALMFSGYSAGGQLLTNDLESYVGNTIRWVAPLIALGRPGEADGAGRILTEDKRWRTDILLLLQRCKAIVIVPSHRPGTLWEIEVIKRERLLSKCVFIMPPRSKKKNLDTRERWESARAGMADLGLEAPEYQDTGMLFGLAPDGKVAEVEPFLLGSKRQIKRSFRRLLDDQPPKGGLLAAVARADRRRRRATWWGWVGTAYYCLPFALAATSAFLPSAPLTAANESWGITFERVSVARRISDYELTYEPVILHRSNKYRSWAYSLPAENFEEAKAQLIARGLLRLKDDDLRDYYATLGEMLDRLDVKTCAAIATGTIDVGALSNVFTYVPSERIGKFLRTRTEALLAELEDRPVPTINEKAIKLASKHFLATLTPSERERWRHLNQEEIAPSDKDRCWLLRTWYGGVTRLDEESAGVWAHLIVAQSLVEG